MVSLPEHLWQMVTLCYFERTMNRDRFVESRKIQIKKKKKLDFKVGFYLYPAHSENFASLLYEASLSVRLGESVYVKKIFFMYFSQHIFPDAFVN